MHEPLASGKTPNHPPSLSGLKSPPRSFRQEFLVQRFIRLSDIEQAMILARMLAWQRASKRSGGLGRRKLRIGIKAVAKILSGFSSAHRQAVFRRLLSCGVLGSDRVSRLLLREHRRYFPALLMALNAAYRGDHIGLLTARGDRRAHAAMIRVIEEFLGVKLERRNIYFVNDDSRNQRLGKVSTAEKKFRVLRNFAEGSYTDEQGRLCRMSSSFRRVYFYDDEDKNLSTVRLLSMANGLQDRIRAVNPAVLPLEALWKSLLGKAGRGLKPQPGRSRVMHFFDIDGTLMQVDARMYVVDRRSGERLLTITQAEFAEQPGVPYWLGEAAKANPHIPQEELEMDFSDFRDAERVEHQISDKLPDNRLFKDKAAG